MAEKLKEIYEKEFKHDPVYRMVIASRLEGYLFPDSLMKVETNKTYSTIEVGEFIGRKDSTIRNYFTTDLLDYIGPEKVGNLYRLDYINIFKIHMISLLFDRGKKSRKEIAYELGIQSGVNISKGNEIPEAMKQQGEDIEKIRQFLTFERLNSNQLHKKVELERMINRKHELLRQSSELKNDKVNKEHSFKDNNYFEALSAAVKGFAEIEQENSKLSKEINEKRSLLSLFKSKKETSSNDKPTLSNTSDEISKILKKSMEDDSELQAEILEIDTALDKINTEVDDLQLTIETIEAEIKKNDNYIQQLEQNLLDNKVLEIEGERVHDV